MDLKILGLWYMDIFLFLPFKNVLVNLYFLTGIFKIRLVQPYTCDLIQLLYSTQAEWTLPHTHHKFGSVVQTNEDTQIPRE